MTDMRERVARAMQKADAGPICCLPDNEFFNAISAVALKECGYAEMRKAMEALIECHGDPEAIAAARSILERTGEK